MWARRHSRLYFEMSHNLHEIWSTISEAIILVDRRSSDLAAHTPLQRPFAITNNQHDQISFKECVDSSISLLAIHTEVTTQACSKKFRIHFVDNIVIISINEHILYIIPM